MLGISRIFCDHFRYFFSRTTWWGLFIKYLHCTYIYVALTVFNHSHYGYCKSYCRIDYVIPYAVVRGMVTPPDEIEFTNTISGVLCISDALLWCLVLNSSDKTVPTQLYPKMMRNFNELLCYYILDTILYSDKQNYMDFLDSNL